MAPAILVAAFADLPIHAARPVSSARDPDDDRRRHLGVSLAGLQKSLGRKARNASAPESRAYQVPDKGGSCIQPSERWNYFVLPVIVLTLPNVAYSARFMRSAMLEVIHQDYMTTARAKGLDNRTMLYRHALRNALIPMVTVVGLQLAQILGGAVIIEQIFAWPGLGPLAFDAIGKRDYAVVLALTRLTGAAVMIINVLVDLVYGLVDPRISVS